jgi:hypothetical protein
VTTVPDESHTEEPTAVRASPAKASAVEDLSSGLLNFAAFWKDHRNLLREPSLVCADPTGRLSLRPLPFALQSAVIMYATVAICLWFLTYIVNLPIMPNDPGLAERQAAVSARLEKTTEAKERATLEQEKRRLDIEAKGDEIAEGVQKIALGPSFLLGALVFSWLLRRYVRDYPNAESADRLYLYYLTARTFVPCYIFIVATYIMQRLTSLAVAGEPITRSVTFLVLFSLVCLLFTVTGICCLIAFIRACWPISDLLGFPRRRADGRGFNGPIRVLLLLSITGVVTGLFAFTLSQVASSLYLRLML